MNANEPSVVVVPDNIADLTEASAPHIENLAQLYLLRTPEARMLMLTDFVVNFVAIMTDQGVPLAEARYLAVDGAKRIAARQVEIQLSNSGVIGQA